MTQLDKAALLVAMLNIDEEIRARMEHLAAIKRRPEESTAL
jgi:hypothetical protein